MTKPNGKFRESHMPSRAPHWNQWKFWWFFNIVWSGTNTSRNHVVGICLFVGGTNLWLIAKSNRDQSSNKFDFKWQNQCPTFSENLAPLFLSIFWPCPNFVLNSLRLYIGLKVGSYVCVCMCMCVSSVCDWVSNCVDMTQIFQIESPYGPIFCSCIGPLNFTLYHLKILKIS